ncbi:MAG TPA: methyltransferase [Ktedonobacterales bacterium]|nr:methyltransferase [Ktedonobacterales bacterium]
MRIGIIAQNILERLALAAGKIPEPIVEAFPPLVLARSIMAATTLGVFDALADHALTSEEVAATCGTDPRATAALLGVLASAGYLDERGGAYTLGGKARRWLRRGDPADVSAYIRFNYLQWEWLGELERFIQTGTPIAFHERLTDAEWKDYERGMAAIARLTLPEVVWRTPVPPGAMALLDIGGGHGRASARFLQRHPQLRATVLDLPRALASAPPLPADVAKRIERMAGDALTADLGHEAYDVIYVANLLHHFDASQNASLAERVAAALRPGGIWVIQDGVRERRRRSERMAAAIGDLYFALTSASGFWSFAEMAAWQERAGLRPLRPIRLLTAPGQGLQIATKPREMGGQP